MLAYISGSPSGQAAYTKGRSKWANTLHPMRLVRSNQLTYLVDFSLTQNMEHCPLLKLGLLSLSASWLNVHPQWCNLLTRAYTSSSERCTELSALPLLRPPSVLSLASSSMRRLRSSVASFSRRMILLDMALFTFCCCKCSAVTRFRAVCRSRSAALELEPLLPVIFCSEDCY